MRLLKYLLVGFLSLLLLACGQDKAPPAKKPASGADTKSIDFDGGDGDKQWIAGWRQTSALSGARAGAAAVVVNDHIYVIGGVDGVNFLPLTEFAKINADGSLSPWQRTSSLNEERGFIDAITHDGYIYVVGGGNGPNGKHLLNSVERAKVQADGTLSSWEVLSNGMITPRRCSKVIKQGNFIYSFGGFAGALLDTVEKAPILSNGDLGPWSIEDATMTLPRYVNSVKGSHGNAYVIGGHDQNKGVGITDVEWAVPAKDGGIKSWTPTSAMQTGRYGLASASIGNTIYAIGGLTGLEYLNTIEISDIADNGELSSWRYTTPLTEPRATFSVVTHNKTKYVIGGSNQDGYHSTVEYAQVNGSMDLGFWGNAQEAKDYQNRLASLKKNKTTLPNAGIVKNIRQASMYTYVQVVNEQGSLWLAGPRTELQHNDRIRFSKGVSMSNFYSKELQASFPVILFVSKIEKE